MAKVGYRCGVALLSWRVSLSCRGLIDSAPAPIICSAFALGCLALCFFAFIDELDELDESDEVDEFDEFHDLDDFGCLVFCLFYWI